MWNAKNVTEGNEEKIITSIKKLVAAKKEELKEAKVVADLAT